MCLTRLNTNCGPKYATKDIICYKVLLKGLFGEPFHGIYYSPCKFFKYKLNECVSFNFSFTLPFIGMPTPQIEYNFLKLFRNFDFVSQGLHSFKYSFAAIEFKDCFVKGGIVMKCTIPKGSWYYEGAENELVSDNIIINREI